MGIAVFPDRVRRHPPYGCVLIVSCDGRHHLLPPSATFNAESETQARFDAVQAGWTFSAIHSDEVYCQECALYR